VSQSHSFSFSGSAQPLPAHIQQHLLPLCETLPEAAVTTLYTKLDNYLREAKIALQQNEFLDIRLAQEIASRLRHILDDYGRFSVDHQALIVGAVRYFVKDDDAEHDLHSILGLDDDTAVLNYLLDTIGQPELKLKL
jgi:hypothetical protein